ncbi:MAG: hypothetical protein AABY83_14920 [Pseudomonadota bacterium]
MNKLKYLLVGLVLPAYAIAASNSNGEIQISNLKSDSRLYIGQSASFSFEAYSLVAGSVTVKAGLKFLDPSKTLSDNIADMASTEPDYYISLANRKLVTGKANSVSFSYVVPANIQPGKYAVVVNLDTAVANSITSAVVVDENNTNSFAFGDGEVEVELPDRPNLRIGSVTLGGENGYFASKSKLPAAFRVNLEIAAESRDVSGSIATTFELQPPNQATVPLSVASENGSVSSDWQTTPECDNCATLLAGQKRGATLRLPIDSATANRLKAIPSGSIVNLVVKLDPNNTIPEWRNRKDDNIAVTPIYIFD